MTKPLEQMTVEELVRACRGFYVPEIEISDEAIDELARRLSEAERRNKMLEDRLFSMGAMGDAPCFCCGYTGPGYYQPEQHACAKRHHALKANKGEI